MILTDSVAQIPQNLAKQYHIGVIPFSIIIEDKSYWDGVDISPAELYQRMRTEPITPRTSHPSMGEFINIFNHIFISGKYAASFLNFIRRNVYHF